MDSGKKKPFDMGGPSSIYFIYIFGGRMRNSEQRTKRSCCPMIRLYARPPPQYVSWKTEKGRHLLTGEGGRGRAWSRMIRQQKSLVLYKFNRSIVQSFNPLWAHIEKGRQRVILNKLHISLTQEIRLVDLKECYRQWYQRISTVQKFISLIKHFSKYMFALIL